jgi:hypothetical protein
MRSSETNSNTASPIRRTYARLRLPLAVTAAIAGVALVSTSVAAQRLGSGGGFGGKMIGGAGASFGLRGATPSFGGMTGPRGITAAGGSGGISINAIGRLSKGSVTGGARGGDGGRISGSTGTSGATSDSGGKPPKGGGKPPKGGDDSGDGGRVSGGDGGRYHPRRPRFPKTPIIVAVPTGIAAVTAITSGSPAASAGNPAGGGGSSNTASRTGRRGGSGAPPANERRYVSDEVLTQFAASVANETVGGLARRLRLDRLGSFSSSGVTMYRWKISDRRSVPTVIRSLEAESIVLAAQPNYLYRLQRDQLQRGEQAPGEERAAPSPVSEGDPGQYALAKLRLPQAHELARGDKVLVAVIDSGIDVAHPELAGMIIDSFDALDSDEGAHAHGTAVAGAIVAHARLVGAAPAARILAARAFSTKERTPEATTYSINRSIDWAVARGAHVINMSFTGPRDPSIEQRVAQVRKMGLIVIAAAGNAGPKSGPLYPAAYPNVIAVTATDADDKVFQGANRGSHIAVAAPGVDILLPAPAAAYQVTTGTSFAAAEVSGVVALMLERKPDLGPEGVRKVLTGTARDLGPKGVDAQYGSGLVDAYLAVRSLEPATTGSAPRIIPVSRN